jgi:hypothetical protein
MTSLRGFGPYSVDISDLGPGQCGISDMSAPGLVTILIPPLLPSLPLHLHSEPGRSSMSSADSLSCDPPLLSLPSLNRFTSK